MCILLILMLVFCLFVRFLRIHTQLAPYFRCTQIACGILFGGQSLFRFVSETACCVSCEPGWILRQVRLPQSISLLCLPYRFFKYVLFLLLFASLRFPFLSFSISSFSFLLLVSGHIYECVFHAHLFICHFGLIYVKIFWMNKIV